MPTYRVLAAAVLSLSSLTLVTEAAQAADFHVANSVFVGGQSQPQSQGVTIFHEGLVYDFLNEPAEVIVFDKAQRRFMLLDISRRLRSEISMDDVQIVVDRVKQRLSAHPNPNVKWLVDPSFEEVFDPKTSLLTLKSPSLTYQAQMQATDPVVAAQYHEFSDAYTQFNVALNPSSRPPFPRMMLNAAIERRRGVAKEVHLTTTAGPKATPLKIASRHQLALQLDAADLNRVGEVREYLRSFRAVSLAEYRKGK